MKNFRLYVQRFDPRTLVAIFSASIFLVLSIENNPLSHFVDRNFYLFLNSFFGYKFFTRQFSFFVSDIFVLLIFGFSFFSIRKGSFFVHKNSKYFLFFLLIIILSVAFSPFKMRWSQIFMIFNFFTTFIFFVSIVNLFDENNIHKYLVIVFWGIILAAFFESFVGFYQYFFQKSLGLKKLGEPRISFSNLSLATFEMENGYRWIFDYLFHLKREANILFRATGTVSHANVYGGFMFFSTLSTYYLYLFSTKRWKSAFLIFLLFFQICAIWISFSRSAIFGFVFVLMLLTLLAFFRIFNLSDNIKKRIKKIIGLSFLFFFILFILLFPQIKARGGIVSYPQLSKNSDVGRLNCQKIAFNMIKKRPLTGIGFKNFYTYHEHFVLENVNEKSPKMVHNIFLLIASEEGLLGLSIFLIFVFSVYRAVYKNKLNLVSYFFIVYFSSLLLMGMVDFFLLYIPQGKFMLFFPAAVLSAIGFHAKEKGLFSSP